MSETKPDMTRRLWLILGAALLLRLFSLAWYPLMDTTEARYGEMARIMAETGNWVTPQIDYGEPFWGKPPLFVWSSAASILVLGNNEFAIRLPHWIAAVLILLLLWKFATALDIPRSRAALSVAIVGTTLGFLLSAGAVMTDMLLTLGMTMTMTGFWHGWHGKRTWAYIMYVGLAIGLLSKGPLVVVLAGIALYPWLVMRHGFIRMWSEIWRRLYPLSGFTVVLAIALPWYLLAEQATPGFLHYFIVGEHFQRFLDPGWKGDLYGSGHARTKGSIWLYWLVFSLPWSIVLLAGGVRRLWYKQIGFSTGGDGLIAFLTLWMVSPLLLFTMAANILPAYVLPGMPALGLLLICWLDYPNRRKGFWLFLIGPALLALILLVISFSYARNHSEKSLLEPIADDGLPIYYLAHRPYSAQYYSSGRAKAVTTLPDDPKFYLVIDPSRMNDRIEQYCQPRSKNQKHLLLICER